MIRFTSKSFFLYGHHFERPVQSGEGVRKFANTQILVLRNPKEFQGSLEKQMKQRENALPGRN